jgi:hypothetical protein
MKPTGYLSHGQSWRCPLPAAPRTEQHRPPGLAGTVQRVGADLAALKGGELVERQIPLGSHLSGGALAGSRWMDHCRRSGLGGRQEVDRPDQAAWGRPRPGAGPLGGPVTGWFVLGRGCLDPAPSRHRQADSKRGMSRVALPALPRGARHILEACSHEDLSRGGTDTATGNVRAARNRASG